MLLNPIFTDGMVLQANQPIRIFGSTQSTVGEGGGTVRVDFCGQTAENTFRQPEWLLELAPVDYGGPYEMKITLDGRTVTLHDIYVGDVYLISGQSNMQFKLAAMEKPELAADNPLVRLYSTTRVEGGERFTPADGWVKAAVDTTPDFSAIGFLFGQRIQQDTGHAVGLVTLYQGAAAIQCFLPQYVFDENPQFVIPFDQRYDMGFPWNEVNSIFFDFTLKKLSPFSFGGVVWYQGESNCSEAEGKIYHDMLREMIRAWRKELRTDDLPFAVVQIHDYIPRDTVSWHTIQKAQEDIASEEPFVRTIITKDVSETDLIHPLNKAPVAYRAAEAIMELQSERNH